MAKVSELTAASTLTGAEQVPAVQSGSSVRTTTQDIANRFTGTRGSSIASAASIDLNAATGTNVHITGSTGPITSLGTAAAGVEKTLIFDGAPPITHNATSLILPGAADMKVAAGDAATFVSEGAGNWRCVRYQRATGQAAGEPVTALTSSSGVLTVSGSSGDYFTITLTENITSWSLTNLPATGKAKTIMLRIQQHASAAKTVAWPSSFKWTSGVAPAISTGTSKVDLLALTSFDQGTTWLATLAKDFA